MCLSIPTSTPNCIMALKDTKSLNGRFAIEFGKKKKEVESHILHPKIQEVKLDKLNLLDLWK